MCFMAWGAGWGVGAYFPSQTPNYKAYTQAAANNQIHKSSTTTHKNYLLETQKTELQSPTLQNSKDNTNIADPSNLSEAMANNELVTVNSPLQLSSMIQIDPKVNDVVSLPKKFASESINYEWALAREKDLKEVFYKDPAFQGKQVLGIVCKSSVCEIKIAVTDTKQLNAIGSKIMRLISQDNTGGFDQNLMITYSQPDELGSFYIQATNR